MVYNTFLVKIVLIIRFREKRVVAVQLRQKKKKKLNIRSVYCNVVIDGLVRFLSLFFAKIEPMNAPITVAAITVRAPFPGTNFENVLLVFTDFRQIVRI